ncbi:MAG TPA: hypothetical protein DCP63_10220 [Bacteroidetes bacterium]|nr:hypothetical protein [Bacteroidota bacterium]
MKTIRSQIRMTMALGALSVIALVSSHLALTDIAHGETDVSLEWVILRASALVILMFVASTFVTLTRVLKLSA